MQASKLGIDLSDLKTKFALMRAYYAPLHKRMKILDATDRGFLWKAINAQFPKFQILPDTNWVSYVKNNILASVYSVHKSASILPTSEQDKEWATKLNIAMDQIWNLSRVGFYQFQAGERAALFNIGITQVGWDEKLTAGSGDSFYKGNVTLANVDPMKFMRDPFAPSLETSGYCVRFDTLHESVFLENPLYKTEFQAMKTAKRSVPQMDTPAYLRESNKGAADDYYTLVIFYVKKGTKLYEIHTVSLEEILYEKEINPAEFPFAILYCNLPVGDPVGTSEPSKILANNIATNIMDSIALTAEYKNQRPPKFITGSSGLNIQAFTQYADEAGYAFVVNGQADKAVHYQKYPPISPELPTFKQDLKYGIQQISGVDNRYTGRDTGSITTTGGTERMLEQVTMIDQPKIILYEDYTRRLTQLILRNMLTYAPDRKYFHQIPGKTGYMSTTIPFKQMDPNTLFNYQINISSDLPKNKGRVAQMANMLIEKQMQYGAQGGVQFITPEEWLMCQDLPMKEFWLERMGMQRDANAVEDVTQTLAMFAELVQNGMPPEQALYQVAAEMERKRKDPEYGKNATAAGPAVAGESQLPPPEVLAQMTGGGGTGMMVPPVGGITP